MLLYVVYQFILTPIPERDSLLWARLIATAIMAPLTSILAVLLFRYVITVSTTRVTPRISNAAPCCRKFGWRIYKKIGADGQLVGSFAHYH
jgi:hypothetical protein